MYLSGVYKILSMWIKVWVYVFFFCYFSTLIYKSSHILKCLPDTLFSFTQNSSSEVFQWVLEMNRDKSDKKKVGRQNLLRQKTECENWRYHTRYQEAVSTGIGVLFMGNVETEYNGNFM